MKVLIPHNDSSFRTQNPDNESSQSSKDTVNAPIIAQTPSNKAKGKAEEMTPPEGQEDGNGEAVFDLS